MPEELMRGATHARQYLEDFLRDRYPHFIVAARQQWGLETHELPMPLRYDSYDPLQVVEYPIIGSIVSRTNNWRRVDVNTHGEEVYRSVYSVRAFLWVRTPRDEQGNWMLPEYDTCLRVRDDMTALMRTCILGTPSLNSGGACTVQENTLVEDYLDAIKSSPQTPQWMAGATLSFDMVMHEANYLPTVGTADTITVSEELLTT